VISRSAVLAEGGALGVGNATLGRDSIFVIIMNYFRPGSSISSEAQEQ
jgi:hypothetical protein